MKDLKLFASKCLVNLEIISTGLVTIVIQINNTNHTINCNFELFKIGYQKI